jgi:glycosyltransferase involved in cell wall biosynthesis
MIENKFLIVSPTYNTAPYIEKCVMSAINQTYQNFDYIVIDDCCTDGTSEILLRLQTEHPRFKIHRNAIRTESPLGNFKLGINLCPGDEEDIIITLDGDDWLYDNGVLEYLNHVYQDSDIWMTYGQFISASGKIQNMCRQVENTRRYRRFCAEWLTGHLRTIKRKLWQRIADNDLRDGSGKYYVYYPDAAYVFPAIEMAGRKHSKFIDKILYVYNDLSPLCSADDWQTKPKLDMKKIYAISREIRHKGIYPELRSL